MRNNSYVNFILYFCFGFIGQGLFAYESFFKR